MEELLEYFTFQNIVTILSLLFGIVTLLAFIDQKKSKKDKKVVNEFISRHLERDITIEEIESLTEKRTSLNDEVTKKIPQIGKISILKYQADFLKNEISQNYESLNYVNSQMKKISKEQVLDDLSPEISKLILNELFPKFKRENFIRKIKDRIIVLIALIIVSGAIFPFGLDKYVKFIIGIFLVRDISIYFMSSFYRRNKRKRIYEHAGQVIMVVGIISFLFFSLNLFIMWEKISEDLLLDAILIGALGIISLVIAFVNKLITKKLEFYLERILNF